MACQVYKQGQREQPFSSWARLLVTRELEPKGERSVWSPERRSFLSDSVPAKEWPRLDQWRQEGRQPLFVVRTQRHTWSTHSRTWALLAHDALAGWAVGEMGIDGSLRLAHPMLNMPPRVAREVLRFGGGVCYRDEMGRRIYPGGMRWTPAAVCAAWARRHVERVENDVAREQLRAALAGAMQVPMPCCGDTGRGHGGTAEPRGDRRQRWPRNTWDWFRSRKHPARVAASITADCDPRTWLGTDLGPIGDPVAAFPDKGMVFWYKPHRSVRQGSAWAFGVAPQPSHDPTQGRHDRMQVAATERTWSPLEGVTLSESTDFREFRGALASMSVKLPLRPVGRVLLRVPGSRLSGSVRSILLLVLPTRTRRSCSSYRMTGSSSPRHTRRRLSTGSS